MIARNGRPAAKLVPITPAKSKIRLGLARGKIFIPDDFDSLDKEIEEMFLGAADEDPAS